MGPFSSILIDQVVSAPALGLGQWHDPLRAAKLGVW